MKKSTILLFIAILILGIILRFWQLGSIPNSLNWDEASWGYNAYTIAETGKDEYGVAFPLSFKAFGDFKQPAYIYLDAVAVKIFGLNAFAVRLPSALFGSLSIIFVFLLVYELFKTNKFAKQLAFICMFLFAISPWSIQFSRVAFEANLALFFVILGAWLFIKGCNEKNYRYIFLSIIPLSISSYTYHSEKVFTPLLFAGFLAYLYIHLKPKRFLLLSIVALYIICNITWILDSRTTQRGRSVMFTSHQTEILNPSAEKIIEDNQKNDAFGPFLHNRRTVYINKYLENYLVHFDPNFLFIKGDQPRHHAPNMGVLYLINLPFILYGLYILVRFHKGKAWIILYWFMLGAVASGLAVDAPNASRSMVFLPTWQIFAGVGWLTLFAAIPKKKVYMGIKAFLFCLLLINCFYFLHQYFYHTNIEFGKYWQYGYKEAVEYVKKYENSTSHIYYASDLEQPYIFYLFYNAYNPQEYFSKDLPKKTDECRIIHTSYFGMCEGIKQHDIYITSKENSDGGFRELNRIMYPNGELAMILYEKN